MGFEPTLSAWKADVLAANTNPADLPHKQLWALLNNNFTASRAYCLR